MGNRKITRNSQSARGKISRRRRAADWTFAKPRELLLYLVANPPAAKETLGLVFWPDASPEQLRTSLRAALYQLRRALGDRDWVIFENGRYGFNQDKSSWNDVEVFKNRIASAEKLVGDAPTEAAGAYASALGLYRGDFLDGVAAADWGAARQYEALTLILREELGVDPSQETERLFRTILS